MDETINFQAEQFQKLYPTLAEKCNGRIERAVQIAESSAITQIAEDIYNVKSSTQDKTYQVDTSAKSCTCPDARSGHLCKHRLAVAFRFGLVVQEIVTAEVMIDQRSIKVHVIDSPNPIFHYVRVETLDGSRPFAIHFSNYQTSYNSYASFHVSALKNIRPEVIPCPAS